MKRNNPWEIYKTIIITIWLIFSGWLMYMVYTKSDFMCCNEFWNNQISILGIIVATLIGWQIYSAMDWNSKIAQLSQMQQLSNQVEKVKSDCRANVSFLQAMLVHYDANKNKNPNNFAIAYKHYICALADYVEYQSHAIESCISNMDSLMDEMQKNPPKKFPPNFFDDCDASYQTIQSHKEKLTPAQRQKLRDLHMLRNAMQKNNIRST